MRRIAIVMLNTGRYFLINNRCLNPSQFPKAEKMNIKGSVPNPNIIIYAAPTKVFPDAIAPATARYTSPHGKSPLKKPNATIREGLDDLNACAILRWIKFVYSFIKGNLTDEAAPNQVIKAIIKIITPMLIAATCCNHT